MATASKEPKPFKFPKTMGACADRVYQLREQRLAAQKAADLLEAEEKALREHIINTLPKSEANGIAGRVARVQSVQKTVPTLKDWDKLCAYVKKTGDFDLLQHRLSSAAVEARWDAKKKVPGVEPFQTVVLSVTKV